MFSGSLKRLGCMPERFQAAFEAQRVGSECPPYPIWVFCKNSGLPCKPLPTRMGITGAMPIPAGAIAARTVSGCLGDATRGQQVPTLPNPFSGSLKAADKTPSLHNRIARIRSHACRLSGTGRVGTRCPRVASPRQPETVRAAIAPAGIGIAPVIPMRVGKGLQGNPLFLQNTQMG